MGNFLSITFEPLKRKMMEQLMRIVKPGSEGKLMGEKGETLTPPTGWSYLPAGDAGITRKVTSKGAYWRVEIKKGRRTIALGLWAPKATIEDAVKQMQQLRQSDQYQKKQAYAAGYREKKQGEYKEEFLEAIKAFLNFHPTYKEIEHQLAKAVTVHATPVGSGTVARTQMIPIEQRALLAVMAWMRHQTTGYDDLKIARVKGERRAVRRTLAQQSETLLNRYRQGMPALQNCPLMIAVNKL